MASPPPKVILTRTLPPEGQAILDNAAKDNKIELVKWPKDSSADRKWLLAELRHGGVQGIVCMLGDKIDEEALVAAGPSLKVVSTMSAGFDHIQVPALGSRKIKLGTTPDALTDATADIGAMLVLMASRRAGEGIRAVVNGKWPLMPWSPLLLCGHGLQRATVGVLGFGKIGQLTLKRLIGFGIGRVLYTTSKIGQPLPESKDFFRTIPLAKSNGIEIRPAASLDELAKESDFLVICSALTPETTGLVNAEFLAKMKKSAYVVNTARGPIVDSEALAKAVENGELAGAGLDVVSGEPNIPADHPLVKNEKIVLLPHIGSATLETRNLMAVQAVENCLAGLGLEGVAWANEVATF
ncbi:glyoxylate/hydroxypyruvate reductase-like protein [Meredithblackwellia eburnea MCA 4105]